MASAVKPDKPDKLDKTNKLPGLRQANGERSGSELFRLESAVLPVWLAVCESRSVNLMRCGDAAMR